MTALSSLQGAPMPPASLREIRQWFVGVDQETPLLNGKRRTYVNLDNAATTPPFRDVLETVCRFMEWYSSVHRGTGYKSQLSTEIYDECRAVIGQFFGADPDQHTVIFCGNTTQAIDKLCRRLALRKGERVLVTAMEHHSNMLPWRLAGDVDYVGIHAGDGSIDWNVLARKLAEGEGAIRLVAITGASNVTGCMPPLAEIAKIAHQHGASLLVDAAQLAAHRPINIGPVGQPESIDFLAFSGHKIYAPFGGGALIGPTEFFAQGPPAVAGGGAVRMVTLDDVVWAAPPDLEEAGTPNVVGAVALAKSIQVLQSIGMEAVAEYERSLTRHLLTRLASIPGLQLFGQKNQECPGDRVGVVPLLADGYPHGLLASILGYEYGIGVRHGCFCAHPYLLGLLKMDEQEIARNLARSRQGDRRDLPGFVRISLGLYNTVEEIDYLADSLEAVFRSGPQGTYHQGLDGHYAPENFRLDFKSSFSLT